MGVAVLNRMLAAGRPNSVRYQPATVQPALHLRTAVLDDTIEDAFRHRHSGFRLANDDHSATTAAA